MDHALFSDLVAAKRYLRPRARRYKDEGPRTNGPAIVITTSVGSDQYDGFEHLRDVITRYRRAWARAHLDVYLRRRWDASIRGTSVLYHRLLNEHGRSSCPSWGLPWRR